MTVHVFGNSHTVAIVDGQEEYGYENEELSVFGLGTGAHETSPLSKIQDGKVVFLPPRYRNMFQKYTSDEGIDSGYVVGLVMGTHPGRLLRGPFWRDAAPSWMNLAGKRPISAGVVEAIIDGDQRYVKDLISQILEVEAKVFVISSAPLRRDRVLPEFSAEVLLEVDLYARKRFTDWLAEHKVPFVLPPEGTVDDEGFLLDRYGRKHAKNGAKDHSHGTAEYGALLYKKIEKFIQDSSLETLNL